MISKGVQQEPCSKVPHFHHIESLLILRLSEVWQQEKERREEKAQVQFLLVLAKLYLYLPQHCRHQTLSTAYLSQLRPRLLVHGWCPVLLVAQQVIVPLELPGEKSLHEPASNYLYYYNCLSEDDNN